MQFYLSVLLAVFCINIHPAFSQNPSNRFLSIIIINDGTEYVGNVERETESEVTLRLRNQETTVISKTNIRLFEPITEDNFLRGKYMYPNRFANRYIIEGSAIAPRKKQLRLATLYSLTETIEYGINDHYSIKLSSILMGAPILLNAQANYKIGNRIYWGATATGGWFSWMEPSAFFGYGGMRLTSGSRNNNYTIGGGYFSMRFDFVFPQPIVAMVDFGYLNFSMMKRYTRKISGITEVWVMRNHYSRQPIYMANLGMRIVRREKSAWIFSIVNFLNYDRRNQKLYIGIIPCVSWSRIWGRN